MLHDTSICCMYWPGPSDNIEPLSDTPLRGFRKKLLDNDQSWAASECSTSAVSAGLSAGGASSCYAEVRRTAAHESTLNPKP